MNERDQQLEALISENAALRAVVIRTAETLREILISEEQLDDDIILSSTIIDGGFMFKKQHNILEEVNSTIASLEAEYARALEIRDKTTAALRLVRQPRDPGQPIITTGWERGRRVQTTITGATVATLISGESFRELPEYAADRLARQNLCDLNVKLQHARAVRAKILAQVSDLKALLNCLGAT